MVIWVIILLFVHPFDKRMGSKKYKIWQFFNKISIYPYLVHRTKRYPSSFVSFAMALSSIFAACRLLPSDSSISSKLSKKATCFKVCKIYGIIPWTDMCISWVPVMYVIIQSSIITLRSSDWHLFLFRCKQNESNDLIWNTVAFDYQSQGAGSIESKQ